MGACPQQGDDQIFVSSSDPLPSHPHPAGGESSLTMGGYRQFTMDVCSAKTNAVDASLNMTFSSCCSFSSVILHLLHYEFLQMTLWCILGTLRITMGRSTPSAGTPPREGEKSAKVLHNSVRESLCVAETFPPHRSRALQGRKLTPHQCAVKLLEAVLSGKSKLPGSLLVAGLILTAPLCHHPLAPQL